MKRAVVLSVDFELFSQTFAFQKLKKRYLHKENGERGIEKLLSLFEQHGVRTTFFVTGSLCNTHRDLIKKIKDSGHEIASHALTHRTFSNLSDREIEQEISKSKKKLEQVTKQKVVGFRSPGLYMTPQIARALEKSNYKYDSSIMPSINIPGWYGTPSAPLRPRKISNFFNANSTSSKMSSKIMEFPIAVNPVFRLPVSGAWIRFFGRRYLMWSLKMLLERNCVPVLYVHPWEFVNLPKIKGIPSRVYFRTGEHNFKIIKHMIENVIENMNAEFLPLRDLLEKRGENAVRD